MTEDVFNHWRDSPEFPTLYLVDRPVLIHVARVFAGLGIRTRRQDELTMWIRRLRSSPRAVDARPPDRLGEIRRRMGGRPWNWPRTVPTADLASPCNCGYRPARLRHLQRDRGIGPGRAAHLHRRSSCRRGSRRRHHLVYNLDVGGRALVTLHARRSIAEVKSVVAQ
jgi:hypothetical protein